MVRAPAGRREHPAAAPLRNHVARAGDAVASLTNNTASDTVKQSASSLPAHNARADARNVRPRSSRGWSQPMREAADGVSHGLAPVTDSAHRAVVPVPA